MIDRIRNLLLGTQAPASGDTGTLSGSDMAAVALLIDVASVDGDFDGDERKTIARLLAQKFDLDVGAVVGLMAEAGRVVERSVDHYGFVRKVNETYDLDARIGLLEMLWQVVYADGIVHDFEANLMRRLSGLLHIPDREAGDARKRVKELLDNQV